MTALPALSHFDIKAAHGDLTATFSSSKPIVYKSFVLSNPNRFVVDFYGASLGQIDFKKGVRGKSGVVGVRTSESLKKARVVFELSKPMQFETSLSSSKKVVTIALSAKSGAKSAQIELPRVPVRTRANKSNRRASEVKAYRPIIVMIDPGHGGKDPGASGRGHVKEKNIVLSVAKRLADDLNNTFGFKAKLTRTGDYYISLRDRLNLARRSNADVFIAIHADAYKNSHARGASVFALSESGATSEAARWLAERENSSELMGGVKLANKGSVLRSVLIDLSQTATTGASLEMGAEVLTSLKTITKLHKGRVEQAAFVVLKSPDIPSLLVEMGFVSNHKEVKLMSNPSYQVRVAKALSHGIQSFFLHRPPRGTMVDANKRGVLKHVVIRGDNLSMVAKRYQTSAHAIKQVNGLKTDVLHIGQVLMLPVQSLSS